MKVESLSQVSREHARELWRKYQEHRAYQSPADAEIAAIYKRISNGQAVIRRAQLKAALAAMRKPRNR